MKITKIELAKIERDFFKKVNKIEKKFENFCCPICGGKDFKEIRKSNGILGPGGKSWKVYCVCEKCSVIFQDPEKFTKAKEK